jgi:hypothetical protein
MVSFLPQFLPLNQLPNIEYQLNLTFFLENYIRQEMVAEFVFTDIMKH